MFTNPDDAAAITTPFIDVPGLITGECKVKDGYSYLAITVNADPADPRADDIPGDGAPNWGLHTVDLSITQESLIDLVRSQTAAFLNSFRLSRKALRRAWRRRRRPCCARRSTRCR